MPDTVEDKRYCCGCHYLDEHRHICALNLSYAAFVYPWSERGDCPGYLDEERAKAEQQQSQGRGSAVPYWGSYISGVKP